MILFVGAVWVLTLMFSLIKMAQTLVWMGII